jgi:hypothetical protein
MITAGNDACGQVGVGLASVELSEKIGGAQANRPRCAAENGWMPRSTALSTRGLGD